MDTDTLVGLVAKMDAAFGLGLGELGRAERLVAWLAAEGVQVAAPADAEDE